MGSDSTTRELVIPLSTLGHPSNPNNGEVTIHCYADPCSVLKSEPGDMEGPWNQGLTTRFSNIVGAACAEDGWFSCDIINDVFWGGSLQPEHDL